MKEIVGREIAKRIKTGDVFGVGTGSTVDAALVEIAKRVKEERLELSVVPTSLETAIQCSAIGLKVLSPVAVQNLAWGFDGADEVDSKKNLIKGRGGAMLLEKLMAAKCERYTVIIDEGKLVSRLGEKFPVPVEVLPEGLALAKAGLDQLGASEIVLRQASAKHGPVITERGNLILDAKFANIGDDYESKIKAIPGVVESGLFFGYADEVLVARSSGVTTL